jgi:hypothetical protein
VTLVEMFEKHCLSFCYFILVIVLSVLLRFSASVINSLVFKHFLHKIANIKHKYTWTCTKKTKLWLKMRKQPFPTIKCDISWDVRENTKTRRLGLVCVRIYLICQCCTLKWGQIRLKTIYIYLLLRDDFRIGLVINFLHKIANIKHKYTWTCTKKTKLWLKMRKQPFESNITLITLMVR